MLERQATVIAHGRRSRTTTFPPQAETPLAQELIGPLSDEEVQSALAELKRLGPPFQRVLFAQPFMKHERQMLEVVLEAFHGVDLRALVRTLASQHKLLPLDVWLTLVQRNAEVVRALMDLWPLNRVSAVPERLGVSVEGHLIIGRVKLNTTVFVPPRHITLTTDLEAADMLSPEHFTERGPNETSLVFSLALCSVFLLTGESLSVREHHAREPENIGRMVDHSRERLAQLDEDHVVEDHLDHWMQSVLLRYQLRWSHHAHPQCSAALASVLDRARLLNASRRIPTIDAFLSAVQQAAGVAPASDARVADVLLSAAADELEVKLHALENEPHLPLSWKRVGLSAMYDRLMERRIELAEFPDVQPARAKKAIPTVGP